MGSENKNSLSVSIITLNEEANLERCLKSVQWADEIIVVDSGSTDRTKEIAEKYNAGFIVADWLGFGKTKQFAIDQTSSDWILSLDADEEITPGLKDEIINAIRSESNLVGYKIPRLTKFLDKEIRHSGWYPDYVLRLFKKGSAQFTNALVHEELIANGSIGKLSNHLRHYPYPTLEMYDNKLTRYAELAAKELYRNGKKSGFVGLYLKPLAIFIKHYIIRAGFLDGGAGWQIAKLSARGKRLRYKKLLEMQKSESSK